MKRDINYIDKLEKAINDKYGVDTIKNPKANWTIEKEKDYLDQIKEMNAVRSSDPELTDVGGILVPKELIINKENNRICTSCNVFSFNRKDDVYMVKFGVCFRCYILRIEHREHKRSEH